MAVDDAGTSAAYFAFATLRRRLCALNIDSPSDAALRYVAARVRSRLRAISLPTMLSRTIFFNAAISSCAQFRRVRRFARGGFACLGLFAALFAMLVFLIS